MARWWKTMSRTDAQQKTSGYVVPYLRLTQNRGSLNPDTWFEQVLFQNVPWGPGFFGKNPVSTATATFAVHDGPLHLGSHNLVLTHDAKRPLNHQHPATWIHWGALQSHLAQNNRQGWYVIAEHNAAQTPALSIRFTQVKPAWKPGT